MSSNTHEIDHTNETTQNYKIQSVKKTLRF
jgi:hypothetical protein